MAGRKLAPRGRANGSGRSRTDNSRTLTTIPAEQANKASKARAERPPATLAGVEEGE